jgi:hypothetical protein
MTAELIAVPPHTYVDYESPPFPRRGSGPGNGCAVTSADGDELPTKGV